MSFININDLTFGYEGSAENVFEHVSFRFDSDWRLGFTGRNGRGKTTFLNLLRGKFAYQGTITANVSFDYFPCEVEDPSLPAMYVAQNACPGAEDWRMLREFNRLQLSEDALWRPFETLSKGEQTKILLAALFLHEGGFPLIDEPTNHLDLGARALVAEYLNSKRGFLLVSHDRAFLDACVDHILSINKTNIEIQKGNFSSWYRNKCARDHFERAETSA